MIKFVFLYFPFPDVGFWDGWIAGKIHIWRLIRWDTSQIAADIIDSELNRDSALRWYGGEEIDQGLLAVGE